MRSLFAILISLPVAASAVDFSREIRPILSENCFFCHGPDEKKREAGLRLDEEVSAKKDNDGVIAVVPGNPERSALLQRILSSDPDEVMPPLKQHKVIPAAQIALIKEWIKQGATWGKHWSYEKVKRPEVPAEAKQPIDAFLVQRLKKEKLTFSPEADAATLVRRVSLDLTGLPPTLEELERFLPALQDTETRRHGDAEKSANPSSALSASPPLRVSASSYEKMVDHYLAQTSFGEHWASQWLDLARYADSSGYPSDQPREIWAYRDWVIRALNANMPFDQFTIDQLAGDLLPNPNDDRLIATAFHRNTMTQNEGGTSDEEFRNAAVIDRVNTTFAVWMGTTMACAQCHTHKYDPLTHQEYFQAYAFLNQSADADKKDESPLHSFVTPELKKQRAQLEIEIAALESRFAKPDAQWLAGLETWEKQFRQELPWKAEPPTKVTTQSQQKAVVGADAIVSIPERRDTDSYTLDLPVKSEKITALRLEALPAAGFGNFVLTSVKAQIIPPANLPAPKARFVRVELPGKDKPLQLAEVQVFGAGDNLAFRRPAKQSSDYADAQARRAVDGTTEGDYAKGSVAHTSGQDTDPWWEVELKEDSSIERVVVWNRTDGDVGKRLEGFRVVLLDAKRQTVWKSESTAAPAKDKVFAIGGPMSVTFSAALADHEQTGFSAASVLLPKDKNNQGWGVAPQADKLHTLTLLCASPVMAPAGSTLRVTLEQQSSHKQHTLGKFRLSVTADPRVQSVTALPSSILAAVTISPDKRTPAQQSLIQDHYIRSVAKEAAPERKKLAALQKQLTALKSVTVPVMKDLSGKDRRVTKIQLRGNWQDLGEQVVEGTPAIFPPLPKDAPMNRLTLAQWLVSRDNPLTARVQVNRLWETLFGTGIVRTSEEFGSQGDLPYHPELLDWLASEFMDSGWDVKHMLKLMLMTQAYRQSSSLSESKIRNLSELDPDNRLLARGPRFRPTGEMLRDQALAVSGILSAKMYGPSVRPVAPNMGLSTAFGRSNDWVTSGGEDKHRRSVYTEIRRNSPYASFTTFDAGNREVCMVRRNRTNTPLQAFVTLNDPVFIETNQAMARRMVIGDGKALPSVKDKLVRMFKLCVSREPSAPEIATLTRLHDETLASYQQDKAAATQMATDPIGAAPEGSDIAELAAWTTVANVVMNLDEFLMRR
ncbi:MAG: DUF1553 domain-containing protein [Verrucomicrobiota bacterium]